MMRITIRVPDNTARIEYSLADVSGYIGESRPLTADQLVDVEHEGEDEMIDLGEV